MSARLRVLYVSYHGLGTALVRSQVLPYLRGLSGIADVHLLTYEGASDEAPPPDDETNGMTLHRLRYHKRPNMPAKILDISVGLVRALWIVFRCRIDLLHARSHVAAAIAAAVGLLTRKPWIFDMRGFLADEFVEAGAWRPHGLKYRFVRWVERSLLGHSNAIVVLTERAMSRLRTEDGYVGPVRGTPIAVIPCAVDLIRYRPEDDGADVPTLVYLGSVGTWYLLDEMLRFFHWLLAARPGWTFLIVNRAQQPLIREAIVRAALPEGSVRLVGATYDEIPAILAGCSAGIVLLREGLSKLGSSPIKLSEYLACGLPVVVNSAVGDAPRLLAQARAGVVLKGTAEVELRTGVAELLALVDEGEAARDRARSLAEDRYSLSAGIEAYRDLYTSLVSSRDAVR